MATVDFRIKNLKAAEGTKATLAEIIGSIDATSIVQFQNVMDKLVEKGVKNLILDCAGVKYINSTGLGTLLKYVDTYESMDGHIAFVRVPSKVMLVMEMLGFNALFTIVPDEGVALRLFAGKPPAEAAPAAPAPKPTIAPAAAPGPARAVSPTVSQPVRPSSGTPTIIIAPGQLPTAPAAPAEAAPAAGGYPTSVECPRCGLTLDVSGEGRFKCPRCSGVLVAEPAGKVKFFAPKKARPVSVTLPAQPELVEGLGKLAEGLARQAGLDAAVAGQIGQAVVAASRGVVELAYGGDPTGSLHLMMVPDGKSLTVRISDHGKLIPAQGGIPTDARFAPVTEAMDTVEIKANPKGGNLITMTKSAGG